MPNKACGSCKTILDVHFGLPYIVLCRAIIFLSSFFYSRYRVWYGIEVVDNSCTNDCTYHINFLFQSGWAVCKGLALFDDFGSSNVYLCYPYKWWCKVYPRYVYGSCWSSIGIEWFLWFILVAMIWALNAIGFILYLFVEPVTAHLGIPRYTPAHS